MLLVEDTDDNINLKHDSEIQALKDRCAMLEKTVMDLQSIVNTYKNTLEAWRQHIVNILNHLGMFDSGWGGEQFQVEVMW